MVVTLLVLSFGFGSIAIFSDDLRTIGNPDGRGIAFGLGGLAGLIVAGTLILIRETLFSHPKRNQSERHIESESGVRDQGTPKAPGND